MTLRFDDHDRTLSLSVRDLVEAGPPSGHLVLEVAQSRQARMAAGRAAHTTWQAFQAEADEAYRAEVTLKHTLEVGDWTVMLHGRVDGITEEAGRTVVEEIKSTALDADRLRPTVATDWPAWVEQLAIYLWMLEQSAWPEPVGRLVLISLLDGSRHMLGVPLDAEGTGRFVLQRLARIVRLRELRLRWYAARQAWQVPIPFEAWRPGQPPITDQVRDALDAGKRLLVQAPTGLGKTAAILHGTLSWALQHNKQVFWATSRNTQQAGVTATLERFTGRDLPITWVGLRAKEKVCLNDVVACRPDTCRFARSYYDKLDAGRVVEQALADGALSPEAAMALGRTHEVCPFQLAIDTAEQVDVVVGDVNYALSPTGRLKRLFGDTTAGDWVLVVDEAHQLVDRAREHASPEVHLRLAREAMQALDQEDLAAFAEVAADVQQAVLDVTQATPGPYRDDLAQAELALAPWRALSRRIDELAFDHALHRAKQGAIPGAPDPYLDLSRQVLRFAAVAEDAGAETVTLARVTRGDEAVRLLCLDPSTMLAPWIAALGGFVGCSATLAPHGFYRDLLGLPDDTRRLDVPSPFPPEHRQIVIASRVSTRFADRHAHAPRTAELLSRTIAAVPGNVALYFPSFAMLGDLSARIDPGDALLLAQRPGMQEAERAAWLEQMGTGRRRVVLAAVLGGIFAEGIDLPPGALSAVVVVGPALPPIGLERDLLRSYYEERFGQGFRYASLVPGMTRVVQAAGRLVRRPEDRGVILLVGRRFRWRDHAELLPADWQPAHPDDPVDAVARFWTQA